MTRDRVGPHSDLLEEFPYVRAPHEKGYWRLSSPWGEKDEGCNRCRRIHIALADGSAMEAAAAAEATAHRYSVLGTSAWLFPRGMIMGFARHLTLNVWRVKPRDWRNEEPCRSVEQDAREVRA